MKTAILAVLLLLAVASLVSGAPAESGKLKHVSSYAYRRFNVKYKAVFLLNRELRHDDVCDVWGNAGTPTGILNSLLDAEFKTPYPL
jgi:hypothetical protein